MAQTAEAPRLSVPTRLTAAPASQTPLPIRVDPASWIPQGSFVRVRGLPPTAALSGAHSIGPGSWAIGLHELASAKILLPEGVTETADVLVMLVQADGSVLAEARFTLVVGAAPVHSERTLTPQDKQRALDLIKRGGEFQAKGNVEAARLFYEKAADAGLAEGALVLASTYDPGELARQHVVGGLLPDPDAARRWYERARELGAAEAEERLLRLSASAR
jgi:hypothetical protein